MLLISVANFVLKNCPQCNDSIISSASSNSKNSDGELKEEDFFVNFNVNKIQRTALEADRFRVSNRAVAAIATAVLIDFWNYNL